MVRIGKKSLSLLLTLLLLVSLFTGLGMQAMAAPELPAYTADGTMTELAAGSRTAAGAYSIASASDSVHPSPRKPIIHTYWLCLLPRFRAPLL